LLEACDLSLSYDGRMVVEGLQLAIANGTITAIVGANGSGKSTILKALARLLVPARGAVYLDGKAIHREPTRQIARRLAFLPQRADCPEGLTVRELVASGRFPYRPAFGGLTRRDEEVIDWALAVVGLEDLAGRAAVALSGGERQCAWIAMALAQQTETLLLDEPTTFLDVRHQLEVLDLTQRLHREQGKTVIMVLHDLNLAARYADRMVAIRDGRLLASGSPDEVMRPEMLRELFGIDAVVLRDPRRGTPICVAYGPPSPGSGSLPGVTS
jgi:iron complex transport system ATP-binding protein